MKFIFVLVGFILQMNALNVCVEHINGILSLIVVQPPGEDKFLYQGSQNGVLWKIDKVTGKNVSSVPVLDISKSGRALTTQSGELGLLSVAFHPNFTKSGSSGENIFYVYYATPSSMDFLTATSVISEWKVSNETGVVEASYVEKVILTIPQPYRNHNGGTLLFGPEDDLLYFGFGDGGSGNDPHNNSQNMSVLYGKIIRIDIRSDDFPDDDKRNYAIPSSNPFSKGGGLPEIYAWGLRNPWRCEFSIPKGENKNALICADVGQSAWEEITVIREPGENHGWKFFEGLACNIPYVSNESCKELHDNVTFPVFVYHGPGAIIGGYTYRGTFDDRLKDKYIFTDVSFGIYWDKSNSRYGTNYISDNKLFAISPDRWDSLADPITTPLSWAEEIRLNPCPVTNCPHTISEDIMPGKTNIHSFGTDNEHNIYLTGPLGLHRLVPPSLCPEPTIPPTSMPTSTHAPTTDALPITRVPFREPKIISSSSSQLEVTLRVKPAIFRTNQFEIQTRSYDGEFPGPTISILPGTKLKVTLVNELTDIPGNTTDSILKGNPIAAIVANFTNLHFHGFHVSPEDEDVLDIHLVPGESKTFVYHLPEDHPTGTFWYHSHMHGSGGLHVEGGMAGAVIIRDRQNNDFQLRDLTMMLQQIDLASPTTRMSYLSLAKQTADNLPTNIQNFGPYTRYCLVNGDYNPVLKIFQYETIRLRLTNAGGTYFVNPTMTHANCQFTLIALDGIYLEKVFESNRLILPPGSRVDVLLRCTEVGLFDVNSSSQGTMLGNADIYKGPVFSVEVESGLPSNYPSLAEIDERFIQRTVYRKNPFFSDLRREKIEKRNQFGVEFFEINHELNGQQYQKGSIMRNISLNEIQEWTVTTTDSKQHPYHQHLNHFQVSSYTLSQFHYNETGLVEGSWRDTIPISNENHVVIRFKPRDFCGKFVFHCHVIPHSDKGMMAVAEIFDFSAHGNVTCSSFECMMGVLGAGIAFLILISIAVGFITTYVTNRTTPKSSVIVNEKDNFDLDSFEERNRPEEANLSSDFSGSFDFDH